MINPQTPHYDQRKAEAKRRVLDSLRPKIHGFRDGCIKPGGLTPEASHSWDEHHGFSHLCVHCGKEPYSYGNMGLCYMCVREKNSEEILNEELRSEEAQILIGKGEIEFLIEELRFLKRSHESAYYYGARIDFVSNTLMEQRNLAFPKPIKNKTGRR